MSTTVALPTEFPDSSQRDSNDSTPSRLGAIARLAPRPLLLLATRDRNPMGDMIYSLLDELFLWLGVGKVDPG